MSRDEEDDQALLILVLDINRPFWMDQARLKGVQEEKPKLQFATVLEALLVFTNSYLLMHRRNKLCFIAMGSQECKLMVPSEEGTAGLDRFRQEVLFALRRVDRACREQELAVAQGKKPMSEVLSKGTEIRLAQALSKGLCYANELKSMPSEKKLQVRALLMVGSRDPPAQYNAVMNAVFGAQRMGAAIDCLALGDHSTFLQQAAYLTGGIYQKPEDQSNLLQYLLTLYLPTQSTRRLLKLPKQDQVDFRAACFCHKRSVEIAYVCSVCVSVFCKFSPECPTCGTRARPNKRMKR